MEPRFVQAHREAQWSVGLTLLYLLGWLFSLTFTGATIGWSGLPQWFEWSCLLLPLLFLISCSLILCLFFHDCSLED